MATVNFIRNAKQSRSALGRVKQYVEQEEKTMCGGQKLVSGQNCSPQFADREFTATRNMHHKKSPVWFYHYTQSFHPDEPVTGELAHEVAKEFAARTWPESEVLIATHIDADHIHSHFVVNAVCYKTGKMLRQGPDTLRRLRQISDDICLAHGLSVLLSVQTKQQQRMNAREYRSAVKGESWKFRLMNTIDQCMRYAKTRDEFISLMRSEGYEVKWTDTRKSITYTTPTGMKCRDDRLHSDKYLKENLEYEFRIREEIIYGRAHGAEPSHTYDADYDAAASGSTSYERGVGGDDRTSLHAGSPRGETDRVSERAQQKDRTAPDTDAGGRAAETDDTSGADGRTGWETEREVLFSAVYQTARTATVSPGRSDIDSPADRGGDIVSALVGLGRSLERTQSDAPVSDSTTMHHHVDRKTLRKQQEKKIAQGHAEDDYEEEHIWEQTM